MYARVQLDDSNTAIVWDALNHSTGVLPEQPLSADKARPWTHQARQIVASIYQGIQDEPGSMTLYKERIQVELAVLNLVPWLGEAERDTDMRFDFAIRAAIACFRQPEPARSARNQRVDALLDDLLPDPSLRKQVDTRWSALRMVSALLPEAVLDPELRSAAATEIMLASNQSLFPYETNPLKPLWKPLENARQQAGKQFNELSVTAAEVFASRRSSDKPAFCALLQRLVSAGLATGMLSVADALDRRFGDDICMADAGDVQMRVMRKWLDTKDKALRQSILDFEIEQMVQLQQVRDVQMTLSLLEAVKGGVPLGEPYVGWIGAFLEQDAQRADQAEAGLDAERLRAMREAGATPAAHPATGEAAPDTDPVHAWSVSRLLRWIEGPVGERPFDRRVIAERQRRSPTARAASQHTMPAPDRLDQAATPAAAHAASAGQDIERDIGVVIDEALQSTAVFLLGDVNDLLALATRLRMAGNALQPCQKAREALSRLVNPSQPVDDGLATQVLGSAEQAIAALRSQIRGETAEEQQRINFSRALNVALNAEILVPGKRHGGVIGCPLPMERWGWANAEFNSRWLFNVHHIRFNGRDQPLRPDQALALYVTGSSLSDFAFDITVHLWQRRPGRTNPPSDNTDGLRRMNTTDWYDTYMPCTVLHVPRSH